MTHHNFQITQVLNDNVMFIVGGLTSWAITLGTLYKATTGLFTLAALILSCAVSIATLYKIIQDLKKKDNVED